MKMKTGFRNTQWDPLLLIAQIIAFQSILYVCLGFIMAFMDILVGANHTLDHLFQYHVSNFQSHIIISQNPTRILNWLYFLHFLTGDSCHRLGRTICYSLVCTECICWRPDLAIYRWTNETLPGFHLHISLHPFVHLLVLQWCISIDILMVVSECNLRHCDVCIKWISMSEIRIERDSSWLYTAWYESRFMKSPKNVPWWRDSDRRRIRSNNNNTNSKIIGQRDNQPHGTFRELKGYNLNVIIYLLILFKQFQWLSLKLKF